MGCIASSADAPHKVASNRKRAKSPLQRSIVSSADASQKVVYGARNLRRAELRMQKREQRIAKLVQRQRALLGRLASQSAKQMARTFSQAKMEPTRAAGGESGKCRSEELHKRAR